MKTIHNLLKRKFHYSSVINKRYPTVTGMQRWIIGYLYENNDKDIFQKDLEEAFLVRRSTATGILKLMERDNLIVKKSVPHDARLKKIVLTPKAIEIHNLVIEEIEENEKKICQNISKEDLDVFIKVLKQIKQNLEE